MQLAHQLRQYAAQASELKQLVPLSRAIKQLEAVVLDDSLPEDALAANRSAFTTLQAFVSSLASPHAYPPASIKTVQFQASQGGVRCVLKTTGGDCSRLVQQSLGDLMQRLGIDCHVYFDGKEFQPQFRHAAPRPPARAKSAPPKKEEVEAVRATAAAAGFPSQALTEEQFNELSDRDAEQRGEKAASAAASESLQADLERLDPLLKACAAVPWMPADEDGQQRADKIKSDVVDELEAWGWDIRGALAKVWEGERSVEKLARGHQGGTVMAIKSLVFHAQQLDKAYGAKVLGSSGK